MADIRQQRRRAFASVAVLMADGNLPAPTTTFLFDDGGTVDMMNLIFDGLDQLIEWSHALDLTYPIAAVAANPYMHYSASGKIDDITVAINCSVLAERDETPIGMDGVRALLADEPSYDEVPAEPRDLPHEVLGSDSEVTQ